jgi:hypothetical protein
LAGETVALKAQNSALAGQVADLTAYHLREVAQLRAENARQRREIAALLSMAVRLFGADTIRAAGTAVKCLLPAAYRRFAPTRGCLSKNLLGLFFPFVNISLKCNLKAIEKGWFLLQYVRFYEKMKIDDSICGDKRYCRPRITFGRTVTISTMF